jgi:hypothetical protein
MKKADEILKEAQDREFRRAALVRAGVIRVSPEPRRRTGAGSGGAETGRITVASPVVL